MTIIAEADAPLIDILLKAFPESNRTRLKKAIRLGCTTVDGAIVKHAEVIVRRGSKLEFKKYDSRALHKEKAPFKILHEDESVIIVFKPVGVISSGRTTEKIRSMYRMVNKFIEMQSKGQERVHMVHRLDREVGGLLMFAKTEEAKAYLMDNWAKTKKLYYALVEGVPEKPKGIISSWLKESFKQVMYSVKHEEEDAKWAVTHYEVLEVYENSYALLNVRLETGRKNQIRVHLSENGNPIIGDRKYGADKSIRRQIRLLAYYLDFTHPVHRNRIKVEIPLPQNFLHLGGEHE